MRLFVDRTRTTCWGLAFFLLVTAAFLPSALLVEALARRFNTVRSFSDELESGFAWFRVGCAVNAVVLLVLPALFRRFAHGPDARPALGRTDGLAAAGLYAVTLLVALPGLFGGWQMDEWRAMHDYLRRGVVVSLTRTLDGDNHVLYNALASVTTAVLRPGTLASRLPALILSPLTLPLVFAALRREYPWGRAFLACLPLTGFPLLVQFAHEGRAYGPLFAAFAGLVFLRDDALHGSRRSWILYTLLGIAAVWLHLYAAAPVVALSLGALLVRENRHGSPRVRNLASLLLVGGLSFLLYAPHLPHYFSHLSPSTGTRFDFGLPRLGEILTTYEQAWIVDAFTLPAVACFALGAWKEKDAAGLTALLAAALLWVVIARAGSGHSIRYYSPVLALGLLPAARGVAGQWTVRPVAAVGLWLVLLAATIGADIRYYRLGNLDYPRVARELAERMGPQETVSGVFDSRPLAVYLDRPMKILGARPPLDPPGDWIVLLRENLTLVPSVRDRLALEYELAFEVPSIRGTLQGYRRRRQGAQHSR